MGLNIWQDRESLTV